MRRIILILILTLATASLSIAVEPPDDYCDDQASWQQWERIRAENPKDDWVASLYAFRIGLCSMVRSGKIDTGRATRLFEQMRDAVVAGKNRDKKMGEVEL